MILLYLSEMTAYLKTKQMVILYAKYLFYILIFFLILTKELH